MFVSAKRFEVIGADIHYTYGEHDKIHTFGSTECIIFRAESAELVEGRFGQPKTVAVKKFTIGCSEREVELITNVELLMRWEDLTKLKHENVVPYHSIVLWLLCIDLHSAQYKTALDIIMDYRDGPDLLTMMEEMERSGRTFHMKTLFDFSKQMAHGVAYLHKNNIIHGDLKPSSVLVSQSSRNHFRLRLCGLDNFTASYATYVLRREGWQHVALEVRSIFTEITCNVLDDPFYSALYLIHKKYASDAATRNDGSQEPRLCRATEHALQLYALFRSSESALPPQEVLLQLLTVMRDHVLQDTESTGYTKEFLKLLDLLHTVFTMDWESAKHFCGHLQNGICTRLTCAAASPLDKTSETPNTDLEKLMFMYFQQIRDPSAMELFPRMDDSEITCSADLNRRVRTCGRKVDIWSLGWIMHYLARLTFDGPHGLRRIASSALGRMDHVAEMFTNAEDIFYMNHYEPKDFMQIVDACRHKSVDDRITAEELINKLVALEEHTYGNTWVDSSRDSVIENDGVPQTHRQMFEEMGSRCEYTYSFWKDFVGQGAYGTVYKATVTVGDSYKGNEIVAVKKIPLNNTRIKQMQRDNSWERVKEQWQKLVDLKHPHLVTYHKCAVWKITKGADIEFMMDYCEGGDLDVLIAQCKTGVCSLSAAAVVNYAAQLASGLHFFHQNQFIHGDLKPGNVFMNTAVGDTGNRTLRIGDLDGAVRVRENSIALERRDLAGTGPYMSPEMVTMIFDQEYETVGFPTDVWSLGCVILDLANCSVNIKERIFSKMAVSKEGNLELDKTDRKGFSADAFLFKMAQGYHPFVSELIFEDLRIVIQSCLISACSDRATTAWVLDHINSLSDVGTR